MDFKSRIGSDQSAEKSSAAPFSETETAHPSQTYIYIVKSSNVTVQINIPEIAPHKTGKSFSKKCFRGLILILIAAITIAAAAGKITPATAEGALLSLKAIYSH